MLQCWSPSLHAAFRKWDDVLILPYKTPMTLPHDHLTFFIIMHLSYCSFWCTCIFSDVLMISWEQINVNCMIFYFYFILMEQHQVQDWIVTNLSDWQNLLAMPSSYNCTWETYFVKMLMMHFKKHPQHLVREEEDKWRKIKKKRCITGEGTHCPSRNRKVGTSAIPV